MTLFTLNVVVKGTPARSHPFYHIEGLKSAVFLTFDVLWQKEPLEELLEFLEKRKIKAIFFVTGEWLKKNYPEGQKILSKGHQLGNHTFSHRKLLYMAEEEIEEEIKKFNMLCQNLFGFYPTFFRPPYGEYNMRIVRIASEQDLWTLLWSINLKTLSERESSLIISHLEESLHHGAILLCHTSSPQIMQILPEIIDFIEWKGYTIETPYTLQKYLEKRFPLP